MICVGSIATVRAPADYNTFGSAIDIWAPGDNLVTTPLPGSGGALGQFSGTSAAAPFVTGTVALIKAVDPALYGSLVHPGDSFSYDIFSQAAQAVRHPTSTNPLDGLAIRAMIATGESQSTWRLVTYANGVQPLEGLFDGFLLHEPPVQEHSPKLPCRSFPLRRPR